MVRNKLTLNDALTFENNEYQKRFLKLSLLKN